MTTPEKWDVVTRKGGDGSLVSSVGLIMIDEASGRVPMCINSFWVFVGEVCVCVCVCVFQDLATLRLSLENV